MKPVVSVAEMREVDAAATTPVDTLIQRAGRAVANEALAMLGGVYGRRIVVVAGKGNNGADGRAAAAFLASRGASTTILEPGDQGVPDCDLLIDAAFGTGFRGEYAAPATSAPVLSVDIPSGVNGDTGEAAPGAVRATATVTMAALKPGLLLGEGPARAGQVTVADIGLPVGTPRTHLVEDTDLEVLPTRSRNDHKWSRAVWIAAGSPGMRGAPQLCARACQRAGAGMIHAGSPGLSAADHPAGEAVHVGLPDEGWADTILAEMGRFHAVIVGPGLGRSGAAVEGVRTLVAKAKVPIVIDADGLYAVAGTETPNAVLTPHDGEFTRLAGRPPGADRIAAAQELARQMHAVVLLKGATTVVSDGTTTLLAAAGDARLATAGTGDVLAGVVGAFVATGLPLITATALAAHVHGRAAERGHRVGLVAGDLPDLVAAVLSERG